MLNDPNEMRNQDEMNINKMRVCALQWKATCMTEGRQLLGIQMRYVCERQSKSTCAREGRRKLS